MRVKIALLTLIAFVGVACGGEPTAPRANKNPPVPKRPPMDYGRFQSYTIGIGDPKLKHVVSKGIAVKLGQPTADPSGAQAAVCFDTNTLRMAAGWFDGFLDLSKTHLVSIKGSSHTLAKGRALFTSPVGPGWIEGGTTHPDRPHPDGPLPRAQAHYSGLYVSGDRVVFSYTVGACKILEYPEAMISEGVQGIARTFHVEKTTNPLTLVLASCPGAKATQGEGRILLEVSVEPKAEANEAVLQPPGDPFLLATQSGLTGAAFEVVDGVLSLKLPPIAQPTVFTVLLAASRESTRLNSVKASSGADPATFTQGGAARWTPTIKATGTLGADNQAYTVDTLGLPDANPWNAWIRPTGLDIFSDGRVAISTWNGDVWIVSGIDGPLQDLTWKRYASGLFEGLGLRVVDGKVYVCGRDQITRLHDLNGDGEADYYENFNNDSPTLPIYNAFAFDLAVDSEKNFYFSRGARQASNTANMHGTLLKVRSDGSALEVIARGFREPNGVCVSPRDEITVIDNQGEWIPAGRINWVRKDGYYGYVNGEMAKNPPTSYDAPLCWTPQKADSSGSGQVWVTSDKWGPLKDRLIHLSYGRSGLYVLLHEHVNGQAQGGIVQFPLTFASGLMRGNFHPIDGQLYVCGLRGYDTNAARDGCLQRVRYTGKSVQMPIGLRVAKDGVHIDFAEPLNATTAVDVENYAVEQWNYRWTSKYGSSDYSVENPDKVGTDPVEVRGVTLSPDRKSVFLQIPKIRTVMQMMITYKITTADGAPVSGTIYNTINALPGDKSQ